jgi:hypothetical protein
VWFDILYRHPAFFVAFGWTSMGFIASIATPCTLIFKLWTSYSSADFIDKVAKRSHHLASKKSSRAIVEVAVPL